MRNIYNILFFLICSTFTMHAQESGSIEGTITSIDGFPVSGIAIKVGKNTQTTETNAEGVFRFTDFPTGNHTLTLDGQGIKKQSKIITVSPNQISYVNFVLDKDMTLLNEVVITISETPNKKKETILSGLDIKSIDLPQSLQIITNETIEQQQSVRLSDVVKNVNGVYVSSARGAAQESFYSRGYDMSANNMFKNGFRLNNGAMPEVSSLERVEVLKGSAALLFGNVAPGGVLNMVTKKPLFTSGGSVSMQMGSYAFYKPSIDVYGPLSNNIAYRFTGSYENSESFRDVVKKERYYINPSLLFKVSKKTDIVLQADYLHDNWTPDFGTGIIGKEIADTPRNQYLGATWSNGQTRQASVNALIKHQLNENWKLNFNSSFQNYDRTSKGTERIQPDADGNWARPLGQNKNVEQLVAQQINLQGTFFTGAVKHQLLTGVDYDYSFAQAYTFVFDPKT
ncbi:MAG TPA: TonB-dependent receptor plug domain-containing protein, partial [Flavobacterium sp.]|nr:TonB-dependent receptor plug domain-containing protein [Flavobacterium sp.]